MSNGQSGVPGCFNQDSDEVSLHFKHCSVGKWIEVKQSEGRRLGRGWNRSRKSYDMAVWAEVLQRKWEMVLDPNHLEERETG